MGFSPDIVSGLLIQKRVCPVVTIFRHTFSPAEDATLVLGIENTDVVASAEHAGRLPRRQFLKQLERDSSHPRQNEPASRLLPNRN
jgi:hypothetical protein